MQPATLAFRGGGVVIDRRCVRCPSCWRSDEDCCVSEVCTAYVWGSLTLAKVIMNVRLLESPHVSHWNQGLLLRRVSLTTLLKMQRTTDDHGHDCILDRAGLLQGHELNIQSGFVSFKMKYIECWPKPIKIDSIMATKKRALPPRWFCVPPVKMPTFPPKARRWQDSSSRDAK